MRILLAAHHFPPNYNAGAEWQTYHTAHGLKALGHDVSVVSVERVDAGPSTGVEWVDETIHDLSIRRLSFNRAHIPDSRLWEYRNEWIGDHMRTWWAQERPDLVHVVSGYLLTGSIFEAAESLNLPTMLTLTDFWWLCSRLQMLRSDGAISRPPLEPWRCAQCVAEERSPYRQLGRFFPDVMQAYWRSNGPAAALIKDRQAYLRERFDRVGAVISPSHFLRDIHIQAGISGDRISVSRQGNAIIDRGLHLGFKRKPADKLRVAYLGQIIEVKGVHVLAEATRLIRDPRLEVKIYGDVTRAPDYAQRLRAAIGSDPRITLAGTYTGIDGLSDVLAETDVIVVPSLWYENSPTVLLEAFALKTPAIVSDFGGMAELVQDEVSGLRFKLGDPVDLASKLQMLLDSPEMLEQITAGVPEVRSVADEMAALETTYDQILARI